MPTRPLMHYLPLRPLLLLLLLLLLLGYLAPSQADTPKPLQWQQVVYKVNTKPSLARIARQQHQLFEFFLEQSLHGKGKQDFQVVADRVKNNISWLNSRGKNTYNEAYRRSFPFLKTVDLQEMPVIIMLIPYLESEWNSQKGHPAADYGYWQMVREVVDEIRTLDHAPSAIKKTHPDKIRASATLSTQAAQLHLRRYYFYFAKVAGYSETDAWLLAITSYNWGAGNVKRMLADLESKGVATHYASFYHALYSAQQRNPTDVSLRAAVEYVPSLWNIAQLIKASN